MTTFVLIIIFLTKASPGMLQVPGYDTEDACWEAAKAANHYSPVVQSFCIPGPTR